MALAQAGGGGWAGGRLPADEGPLALLLELQLELGAACLLGASAEQREALEAVCAAAAALCGTADQVPRPARAVARPFRASADGSLRCADLTDLIAVGGTDARLTLD